jgi:hypothetical protein
MLQKAVKKGEIKNIKPGRYDFNFTKMSIFTISVELTPTE